MNEDTLPSDIPLARPSGDLTQGPLFKTLVLFSLPVLLGNVLQSLNGSVNTVWIGRLLGEEALAATSSSNIVMFLVFAAIFGISMEIGRASCRERVSLVV